MAGRRTQRCTVCGDEMRAFCAAELEPAAGKKARGFSWPAGQVPKTLGLRENRLVGHSKLGLPLRRRRFAGAERGSRVLQVGLMYKGERMRTTEHATRDPSRVLERRHCLAKLVERGSVVLVERLGVNPPHRKREFMTLSKSASRCRYRSG